MAMPSDFADDAAFRHTVGAVLDSFLEQADEIDADIDPRLTPGSFSITFEDGSVLMLSQQTPTHELWLSANYTAWHFRCEAGTWKERDTGEDMCTILSTLLTDKLAQPTTLTL